MNKDVEIGQINELKFYLAWDYVKDICNEAMRKENQQLHKFLEEFNALDVAKENQQLKELLSKCLDELAEFNNSYYPETQELFSQITNAIGEKK